MTKEQRFKDALILAGIIKHNTRITIVRNDYGTNNVIANNKVIGKCSYNGTNYFFEPKRKEYVKGNKTNYKNKNKVQRVKNNRRSYEPMVLGDIIKVKRK